MRALPGKAGDRREEMRGEDVGGARSQVGRRAGEQLEEQDSQGVDVAGVGNPRIGNAEYRVKLTLESKDRDYLKRAFDYLLGLLPRDVVVKTE